MTAALEGGEWSAARPVGTLPPGKTRYPFYRRLGGLQGRTGRAENLVPTGIRSRTVQPVAQSLYRLSYPARIIANIFSKWIKLSNILITHGCGCSYFLSTRTDFLACKLHASAKSYIISLWWCPHTWKLWRDVPAFAGLPRDEATTLGVTIRSTPCIKLHIFLRDRCVLWTH